MDAANKETNKKRGGEGLPVENPKKRPSEFVSSLSVEMAVGDAQGASLSWLHGQGTLK